MADWKKIAREYIQTDIAMRPLAVKYNVSFPTLRDRAKREAWSTQRNEYRMEVGKQAIAQSKKRNVKNTVTPSRRDVSEAELIFTGAELAINWIINRLESGEVEDYREVESLIRALNGTKTLTKIKTALDEQEQRARIANLEKQTEVIEREPIRIEFAGESENV